MDVIDTSKEVIQNVPAEQIAAVPEVNPYEIQVEVWHPSTKFDAMNIALYGDSGVGKTRFASTFPKVVFLDAEKGMASVTLPVGRIKIDSWDDLKRAYRFLRSGQHSFQSVALDSLNEIQYLAMQNVIRNFPEIKRSYGELPGQSDYGKALSDFDALIRAFCDLPMHTVLIVQEKDRQFETDKPSPLLIGKHTVKNVTRKVEMVGWMYKTAVPEGSDSSSPTRVVPIISFNEQEHSTKDRTGRMPATIIEPTFEKMEVYWRAVV